MEVNVGIRVDEVARALEGRPSVVTAAKRNSDEDDWPVSMGAHDEDRLDVDRRGLEHAGSDSKRPGLVVQLLLEAPGLSGRNCFEPHSVRIRNPFVRSGRLSPAFRTVAFPAEQRL